MPFMKIDKSLLLVVDVQTGFVVNEATRAIVPKINELIDSWHERQWPVVFSKFINTATSPWVRLMGWQNLTQPKETDLYPELRTGYGEVYEKTTYSAWSDEIAQKCIAAGVQTVVLVGIDTDQCVLATAIGIFDAGLRPLIVSDCCATSAEATFHDAGLLLLERLVGEKQMVTSRELV